MEYGDWQNQQDGQAYGQQAPYNPQTRAPYAEWPQQQQQPYPPQSYPSQLYPPQSYPPQPYPQQVPYGYAMPYARQKKSKVGIIIGVTVAVIALAIVAVLALRSGLSSAPTLVIDDTAYADDSVLVHMKAADVEEFLSDESVTDDDIRVANDLVGYFHELQQDRLFAVAPRNGIEPMRPILYVASMEGNRAWPGVDSGWSLDDGLGSIKGQVRMSLLCKDEVEKRLGGTWRVIGCIHPSDDAGDAPQAGDAFKAILMREDGEDKGLIAIADFLKWDDDPTIEIYGTDVSRERIAFCRECTGKVTSLPSLGRHRCFVLCQKDSENGSLTVTIFLFEDETDETGGFPFRDKEALAKIATDARKATDADTVDVLLCANRQSVSFERMADPVPISDMQTVLDGGFLRPVPESLDLLACVRAVSDGNPLSGGVYGINYFVTRYQTETEAEAALGYAVTVPEEIDGRRPFAWDVSVSENVHDLPDTPALCVKYGTPEETYAVIALGPASVTSTRHNGFVVSFNEASYAQWMRKVTAGNGEVVNVCELSVGVTVTWESTDGNNAYMAYVAGGKGGMPSDDRMLGIVNGTRVG